MKGIDVLLIGCGDLCVEFVLPRTPLLLPHSYICLCIDSLDIPGEYDNPTFHAAVAKVCAAASKNGIFVGLGGLETRPDMMEKFTSEYSSVRYVLPLSLCGSLVRRVTSVVWTMVDSDISCQEGTLYIYLMG